MQGVCKSTGEPVKSRLCGSVHVVGSPDANAGDRAEHDDLTTALSSQQIRHNREDTDLRHIIGVYDPDRMGGILFRQGLVSEHSERNDHGPDPAVIGGYLLQQRLVDGSVIGVELEGMYLRCPCRFDPRYLLGQLLATPSCQVDGPASCEADDSFAPDFTSASEQQDSAAINGSPPNSHSFSVASARHWKQSGTLSPLSGRDASDHAGT